MSTIIVTPEHEDILAEMDDTDKENFIYDMYKIKEVKEAIDDYMKESDYGNLNDLIKYELDELIQILIFDLDTQEVKDWLNEWAYNNDMYHIEPDPDYLYDMERESALGII